MSDLLAPLPIAAIPRLSLRAEEAAAALSVSARTLHNWRLAGVGPPSALVGGVRLYGVDELRDWLASQSQKPEATTAE